MPLIVVLGHDPVEGPVGGPQKERVGGEGPVGIDPGSLQRGDGRDDDPPLFVAEQPPLAAVGIEGRHTDPRAPPEKRCQEWSQSLPGGDDPRRRESAEGAGERLVERHMDDPQPPSPRNRPDRRRSRQRREPEHHRRGGIGEPTGPRQPFGVAGEFVPGRMERCFVERAGDESGMATGIPHDPERQLQRPHGRPTAGRRDPSPRHLFPAAPWVDGQDGSGGRGARIIHRHPLHGQPRQRRHAAEHFVEELGPGDDAEPGPSVSRAPAPGRQDDLRTDAGRIATRQADDGAGGGRGRGESGERGVAGGRQGMAIGWEEGDRKRDAKHRSQRGRAV